MGVVRRMVSKDDRNQNSDTNNNDNDGVGDNAGHAKVQKKAHLVPKCTLPQNSRRAGLFARAAP